MINKIKKGILPAAALAMLAAGAAYADEVINVMRNGAVQWSGADSKVERAELNDTKTQLSIKGTAGDILYSGNVNGLTITFGESTPQSGIKADLMDIVFNPDGTATDISPMHHAVTLIGKPETYYSQTFGRNVAHFANPIGGAVSNGYRIDYVANQEFQDKLADGHTLEAIVMADYEGTFPDTESKPFSSHEAGGTGLMVCKPKNGKDGKSNLTFLPNTGGYRWATSGVYPEAKKFYHLVGVYNREEEKAYVYVDGQLMNTVDAKGNFKFASTKWFCIGGDSDGGSGGNAWNGDVAVARVYDKPMTADEVSQIYAKEKAQEDTPKADLLDVVFNPDGTATDVSPMKMEVKTFASSALTTYFNPNYERYVAKFANTWAGSTTGYYRIDYASNQSFIDKLSDGHTLEAVVMADYEDAIPSDGEAKFFASHEAGGTGLMVCKKNNSMDKAHNDLIFLPNVSPEPKNAWKWCVSGVEPKGKTYYHVVGVWNKEEGKAYVYINGELKNTIDAVGNLNLPKEAARWFCIGGDSQPTTANFGWVGDVVTARIYDQPLGQEDVSKLWNIVEAQQANAVEVLVSDVKYLSGMGVKVGAKFTLQGKGFKEGDQLQFTSSTDASRSYKQPGTVKADGNLEVTIPEGFQSDNYRLTLFREAAMQDLGLAKFEVVSEMPKPAEVIAHRGFWTGTAQNSRQALKNAQDNGFYGSENDIWITTDGRLVVNHDATLNGVTLQNSTYDQVKNLTLSNGEKISTLEDQLEMVKSSDSRTKLIIEIKSHSSLDRSLAAAEAAVKAVETLGVKDKVEYIAFDRNVCKKIAQLDPKATVAYLSGGEAPATLKADGITGIDYSISEFRNHPEWVKAAKDLGMVVNVWTVNSISDMAEMTNLGVQFITTDKPLDAQTVADYYKAQQ